MDQRRIREAVYQGESMNQDDGSYQLLHIYDVLFPVVHLAVNVHHSQEGGNRGC